MPGFSSQVTIEIGHNALVMEIVRMLLGIGNTLLGDDGVGNHIASLVRARGWNAIDCGTMPENFTVVVRRHHPEILVLVDATDLGLSPGEFRMVSDNHIEDVSIGTHNMPLSFLMEYLAESAGRVLFIGVQPLHLGEEEGISPAVIEGAERLMTLLRQNRIGEIQAFQSLGKQAGQQS